MVKEKIYHVLVIDDDEVDRQAVVRGLAHSGLSVSVEIAGDGNEGLSVLQDKTLDCLFLDYRLGPGSDGLEITRKVRESGNRIPIVVLTGYGDERVAVSLLKAGASDYLPKSVLTPDVLGRCLRNAVAMHEVDEQRLDMEGALKESEGQLRAIFEAANDAIMLIQPLTDRILKVNPRATALLGYSTDDFQNLPASAIIPAEEDTLARLAKQDSSDRAGYTGETVCHTRQNGDIQVEISASLIRDPEQPLVLTLIRDITERKQLEQERGHAIERAMASERLSSIGEMASGIAHELNQPLQIFKLTLYNLDKEERTSPLGRDHFSQKVAKLQQLVDDMSTSISRLAGYARPDDAYGRHSLRDIAESALAVIGRRLEMHHVTLQLEIPDGFTVWCRRNAMTQALVNLLANAMDAYQRRDGQDQSPGQRSIVLSADISGGNSRITVTDRAGGIPATIRDRVFEPFVSTKSAMKSIGMGLHIVRQILEEHEGEVRFQVEEDVGTKFELLLPQHEQTSPRPEEQNMTRETEAV